MNGIESVAWSAFIMDMNSILKIKKKKEKEKQLQYNFI